MSRKNAKAPDYPPVQDEEEPESEELDDADASDEMADDEPTGRSGKPIAKAEAVRRALTRGFVTPEEGTDYIRRTFGLEMSRQHFSATKSQMKSKGILKGSMPRGKPGRKPKGAAGGTIEGYLAPPRPAATGGTGGELLNTLEALKPLIAQHGADQVKRMVDLLG